MGVRLNAGSRAIPAVLTCAIALAAPGHADPTRPGLLGNPATWSLQQGDWSVTATMTIDGPDQTGKADTYEVVVKLAPVGQERHMAKGPGSIMVSVLDDRAYVVPGTLTYKFDYTDFPVDPPAKSEYTYTPPAKSPEGAGGDPQAERLALEYVLGKVPFIGDLYGLANIARALMSDPPSGPDFALSSGGVGRYYRDGDADKEANVGPDAVFTNQRFMDCYTVAWEELSPGTTGIMWLGELRWRFEVHRPDPRVTPLWVRAVVPCRYGPIGQRAIDRFIELEWGTKLLYVDRQKLPDLVVEKIVLEGDTLKVTVRNAGPGAVSDRPWSELMGPNCYLGVKRSDGKGGGGKALNGFDPDAKLKPPGGTATYTYPYRLSPRKEWTITATIDDQHEIKEVDETNNSLTVTVGGQ